MRVYSALIFAIPMILLGCSDDETTPVGSGGSAGSAGSDGGSAGSAGNEAGKGGSAGKGGTSGKGGSGGKGGTGGTGGSDAGSGGGGQAGMGGESGSGNAGGSSGAGGSDATGGSSGSGGSDATGGSSGSGGSDATGGSSGSGGTDDGRCTEENATKLCASEPRGCAFVPEDIDCDAACNNIKTLCEDDSCVAEGCDSWRDDQGNVNVDQCKVGCNVDVGPVPPRRTNCSNVVLGCYAQSSVCDTVGSCVQDNL